ncbi:MAG: efflux RND transporter periplasmic adaptor subunit [Nitrospirota bacterium]
MTHASLAMLVGLLLTLQACEKKKPPAPPPPAVEVVSVIQRDIPVIHEWVGTADGLVNATIRPQVTGYLIRQKYVEGDIVEKGQVLFEIDPRPFQAALDQAKGTLAQFTAQWEDAKANLARVIPLAAQNALSKKDLDDATGAERSAMAQVVAASAAVENARINLGFTKVISPIHGMAGLATTQIGNLVGPALGRELTTVSTIQPIKVYYSVNEQAYIDFMRRFSTSAAGLEKARKLQIKLVLADGTQYPYKGTFYAIDRQVDVTTGTLRVAAVFPNPRNLLRPGQFVRVRVLVGTKKGALLIPQRAVNELQGSYQVAVLGTDNRVYLRNVKPGESVGMFWVIEQGLRPGERMVAEGAQKVKQGTAVTPMPFALSTTAISRALRTAFSPSTSANGK